MSPTIGLEVRIERFRLREAFTISRGSRTEATVVSVRLAADGAVGRGECVPYARYGETVDGVVETIEALRDDLAHGLDRIALQERLPPGAARNALDCAFWDLEAKQSGQSVAELAGRTMPDSVISAFTLSLDVPERMRERAAAASDRPVLKIKLGGTGDIERLRAVREGAPHATLVVDANEGWDIERYQEIESTLASLGVAVVEQPLPAGDDTALVARGGPVRLCADESCHARDSLDALVGRYDMVNIKLDKTGGLTEALALIDDAIRRGFDVMVGCMMSSSLAIAPAMLLAPQALVVDLDPPLLLAEDRDAAIPVSGSVLGRPLPALWG